MKSPRWTKGEQVVKWHSHDFRHQDQFAHHRQDRAAGKNSCITSSVGLEKLCETTLILSLCYTLSGKWMFA